MSVTKREFLNYVRSLVGTRNDVDGFAGSQCVDLIKLVYQKYWGFTSWGNAIDYQSNAMPSGFVRYKKGQAPVQAGDILVWRWKHFDPYGHIGICVGVNGNSVTCVEQNVDGGSDSLRNGGPARYRTRTTECLAAILRPPFEKEKYGWIKDNTGWWFKENDGSYPVNRWKNINSMWYYFDQRGYAVTGWKELTYSGAKRWFYFDEKNCDMKLGWQHIKWNGAMRWFYFERSGAMVNGVHELEWQGQKHLYAFDENGCLIQNGSGKAIVYANPDGSLKV